MKNWNIHFYLGTRFTNRSELFASYLKHLKPLILSFFDRDVVDENVPPFIGLNILVENKLLIDSMTDYVRILVWYFVPLRDKKLGLNKIKKGPV